MTAAVVGFVFLFFCGLTALALCSRASEADRRAAEMERRRRIAAARAAHRSSCVVDEAERILREAVR